MNEENLQTSSDELDQMQQVRQALFCFLRGTMDKLPAWSSFWQQHEELDIHFTPERFRASLSDLKSHDNRTLSIVSRVKRRADWCHILQMMFEKCEVVADYSTIDKTETMTILKNFIDRSHFIHRIKDIIQLLKYYQPQIRHMLDFTKLMVDVPDSSQGHRIILQLQEGLTQSEKVVEDLLERLRESAGRLEGCSEVTEDLATELGLKGQIGFGIKLMAVLEKLSSVLQSLSGKVLEKVNSMGDPVE